MTQEGLKLMVRSGGKVGKKNTDYLSKHSSPSHAHAQGHAFRAVVFLWSKSRRLIIQLFDHLL